MVATVRRWWVFMALSALLNFAALALAGYFWPSLPAVPPPAPKLLLLTLLPPTPKVKPPPRPKPPPKPPAPKRQPRARATPLPPAPYMPDKFAPVSSGGGSSASRPPAMPQKASQFKKLAVNVADADVSQFLNTFLTDEPERKHPDKGIVTTSSEHGTTKTTDGDHPAIPTSGTQNTSTQAGGQTGTTSGNGGGTGKGPGPGGAGPFGITGTGGGGTGPRHVVYVLDISGSMAMTEAKFNGKKRIDKAREELKAQIQSLSDGELFSIIVFSDEVRAFRRKLASPTKDTTQDAFRFLDEQVPHDATDLERALNMALGMPEVNLIYVITDGVPWPPDGDKYGPKDFPALAERIRKANVNHIPIYTIGLLGPNPDDDGDDSPQASALLTQLAQDSGGKFEDVRLGGENP